MAGITSRESRLIIAKAMLKEDMQVLSDVSGIGAESLYPIDILLPGTPKFAALHIDATQLLPRDLLVSHTRYLQNGVVMPSMNAAFERRNEDAYRKTVLAASPDTPAAKEVADAAFERYKRYMIDKGLTVTFDRHVYNHFNAPFARRGSLADLAWGMMDEMTGEIMRRASVDLRKPVTAFPSPALEQYTEYVLVNLSWDIAQVTRSIARWNMSGAERQRSAWLETLDITHRQSYDFDRDYHRLLRRKRSRQFARLRQRKPPSPSS